MCGIRLKVSKAKLYNFEGSKVVLWRRSTSEVLKTSEVLFMEEIATSAHGLLAMTQN